MNNIPIQSDLPRLDRIKVTYGGREFFLPYVYRAGRGGPAVLFVHGLGGAKENFHAAFQTPALADCTLVTFDQPGTGLAAFHPDAGLDVSALAGITQQVANQLMPERYFVVGASMGGLIALLQMRQYGTDRVRGFVSLEGNLTGEDCMFSRRVVPYDLDSFEAEYPRLINELRRSQYTGDRIIAHNLALNVDVRGYHTYSFETVAESDSGRLLEDFVSLEIPRLFIYGEANEHLSYLPRLRASDVQVRAIAGSGHFVFYDNPVDTFAAIGEFVHAIHTKR